MKIANINYYCELVKGGDGLIYSDTTPFQAVIKVPNKYTLVVFKSGRCRIMGCKEPIYQSIVIVGQIMVRVKRIQSLTITVEMGRTYHLRDVAERVKVSYEPELFPAARLLKYRPLCVNLFASGKVVIMGLKTLHYYKQVETIITDLQNLWLLFYEYTPYVIYFFFFYTN